jgi:hypothetical protein
MTETGIWVKTKKYAKERFLRENDYDSEDGRVLKLAEEKHDHHGHESLDKLLFTGYWAFGDSFFARGWLGLIYALWVIPIGIVALLQVTNVFSSSFVVTLALVCTELCVTAVFTGILAWLVKWADDSLKVLRRVGSDQHSALNKVSRMTIASMARSRYNANNDFKLLSSGLVWSIIEATIACVLATGVSRTDVAPNINIPYLSGANGLDTANAILSTGSLPDFATAHLVFILQMVIVVKFVVQLGRAPTPSSSTRSSTRSTRRRTRGARTCPSRRPSTASSSLATIPKCPSAPLSASKKKPRSACMYLRR